MPVVNFEWEGIGSIEIRLPFGLVLGLTAVVVCGRCAIFGRTKGLEPGSGPNSSSSSS
jgi:hypothetical protein